MKSAPNATRIKFLFRSDRVKSRLTLAGLLFLFSVVSFFFFNFGPRSGSHPSGYAHYREITVNHAMVAGNSPLENFPVLVSLQDNEFRSTANGGQIKSIDGFDIIFTDENGDRLPFQIEEYSPSGGKIIAWVRVNLLKNSENTVLRMYYDNSSASSDPSTNLTWSSDYNAVYHLNNSVADNSGNGFDAVRTNSTTENNGFYASGEKFDGNNDFLTISSSAIPSSGGFTYSLWVKPDDGKESNLVDVYSSQDGGKFYTLGFDRDSVVWKFNDGNNDSVVIQASANLNSGWHQIVATGQWNGNDHKLYFDGQLIDSSNTSIGDMFANPTDIIVGYRNQNYKNFDEFKGKMDEFRIMSVQVSQAWVETEFNNLSNIVDFYTVSPRKSVAKYTSSQNKWGGTVSTDWFDSDNWTQNHVPTKNDSAIIPPGTPYSPVVASGLSAEVQILILEEGNSLELSNNANMKIYGDAFVDGVTSTGTGEFIFTGSSNQNLHGKGQIEMYDVTINNSGNGLQLHNNLAVSNQLNFQQGMLYAENDTLKLMSVEDDAVVGFNKYSYVSGYLARKIERANRTYVFPVGKGSSDTYYRADIVSKYLRTTSFITVHFTDVQNHDDNELFILDLGMTIRSLNSTGVWVIEPDVQPTGGSYDVKLYTENFEGLTDNKFSVVKRPMGSGTDSWSLGGGLLDLFGLGRRLSDGFSLLKSLSSFSEFGIGSSDEGTGLPIELSYFAAELVGDNSVLLSWETYTEINNDFFTIEHSSDGKSFTEVGTVKGAGNSVDILSYEFTHEGVSKGENYYRLKQTDFDGQFEYFDIKSVYVDSELEVDDLYVERVGPNPFQNDITVNFFSNDVRRITIRMYDLSGAVVFEQPKTAQPGSNKLVLNSLPNLSQGNYIIELSDDNTFRETVKVMKTY